MIRKFVTIMAKILPKVKRVNQSLNIHCKLSVFPSIDWGI